LAKMVRPEGPKLEARRAEARGLKDRDRGWVLGQRAATIQSGVMPPLDSNLQL